MLRNANSDRHPVTWCLVLTFLVAMILAAGTEIYAQSQQVPNIIFILADDMGYGDVHALNPKSKIPTPHLDRLAREGMTFTDAHSPSAVCTPTRYGVLTGRYCWRSRLKRGVLNGFSPPLIERNRPTVASFLKAQGYATGIVGKWHLGLGFAKSADGKSLDFNKPIDHGPKELGFDFSYVIPASLDFPPYVYIRDGQVTEAKTVNQPAQKFPAFLRRGPRAADLIMTDVLDHLSEQAAGFIERKSKAKKRQPFFLYFPLTAPHKPVLPHPRFKGKTKLGPYGDFIVQVDWTVGQILKKLDDCGIADETLVIYTSDNGSFMRRSVSPEAARGASVDHVADETVQAYLAANHTANYEFRGTKTDIWEAGHRVPFFARWPNKIKPASKCSETICLTDFFATTAQIVVADVPQGGAPDSFSLLPLLEGKTWHRPPVIHHSASGMFAIRDGKWKLVAGNGSGGRQTPRGKPFQRPFHLFDLESDVAEQKNLVKAAPEVAFRLEKTLEEIRGQGGD